MKKQELNTIKTEYDNKEIYCSVEDRFPEIKEIVGKYNVLYVYTTFIEGYNSKFRTNVTTDIELATEEHSDSFVRFTRWIIVNEQKSIDRDIQQMEYETYSCPFEEEDNITIEEFEHKKVQLFRTYKITITSDLVIHARPVISKDRNDLIETMEHSNYLLSLVDDGFNPCIVSLPQSWHDKYYIVLDDVIYTEYIDTDTVKFIETSENEITMYLKDIETVKVIRFKEKPEHLSLYDSKFDVMLENVTELYNEYKSFYARGSGETLYEKVLNACQEKNWDKALENFSTLHELIADKTDLVNPYVKEKSLDEAMASLMNKWGVKK